MANHSFLFRKREPKRPYLLLGMLWLMTPSLFAALHQNNSNQSNYKPPQEIPMLEPLSDNECSVAQNKTTYWQDYTHDEINLLPRKKRKLENKEKNLQKGASCKQESANLDFFPYWHSSTIDLFQDGQDPLKGFYEKDPSDSPFSIIFDHISEKESTTALPKNLPSRHQPHHPIGQSNRGQKKAPHFPKNELSIYKTRFTLYLNQARIPSHHPSNKWYIIHIIAALEGLEKVAWQLKGKPMLQFVKCIAESLSTLPKVYDKSLWLNYITCQKLLIRLYEIVAPPIKKNIFFSTQKVPLDFWVRTH